jgi:hypothetical protein
LQCFNLLRLCVNIVFSVVALANNGLFSSFSSAEKIFKLCLLLLQIISLLLQLLP